MYTVNCKADTCNNLSEECMECKLIKEDDTKEMNKIRQLQLEAQERKEKMFRRLVGGSI